MLVEFLWFVVTIAAAGYCGFVAGRIYQFHKPKEVDRCGG